MKKLILSVVLGVAFASSADAQVFTVNQIFATTPISGSSANGAYNYGLLSYMDTNVIEAYQANVNSYAQNVLQNTNAGATASADFVVSNNLGTSSAYYADFGINSSGFTGTGAFNAPNASYLTATSGDLAIGTTTANAIHFVVAGSSTDAMTISSSGAVTFGTPPAGLTASNLAGGTANQIPYQTGAGATSFYSASNYGVQTYGATGTPAAIAGAAGVLQGSASAIPVWTTSPTLTAPVLGTPASGTITNLTGTCTSCTASNATTAVNQSGGTVAATTISASGLVSPANTIGVKGTALATAMQAGSIGETFTATGTAVNLAVSGTVYQIATVSPTIGQWDIFSECYFTPAATTTTSLTEAGVSTTTAVLPAIPLYTVMPIALAANTPIGYSLPTQRVLLSGTTPYYVNASAAFAVSTISATCTITAVRTN